MAGNEIAVRADSLPAKIQYAEKLAQAGLLPDAYRRQPANVLYAIEYGEMLNIPAMAAINGIHVIKGKPTASAALIASLVRRAGHRLRQGYDAESRVGWAEIVRSDDPEFTFRSEWSLERAVAANLCRIKDGQVRARDKDDKPTPWELYTQNMQKHRALTECARDACEEALNGVHYTPEELGEPVDAEGDPIQVKSERVDAPEPAQRPEPQQQEIDWDAELEQRAGNVEALKDLYKMAAGIYGNSNPELAERIAAAGKAAAESPAETTPADEPVDAELVADEPAASEAEPVQQINTATRAQITKLTVSLAELGVKEQSDVHATLTKLLQRPISSRKDLTRDEATTVIDLLERCLDGSEPARKFDAVMASLEDADATS